MVTVYLGLGSNIGDSREHIEKAISSLSEILSDPKQAPFYRSKAVGFRRQPDFLNTVVSGRTDLSPQELLEAIKRVERQIGRTKGFRNGPREIDIDIILYDDRVLQTDKLTLPHPRFRERDFVLKPLSDLNPSLIDPVSGRSIKQLLEGLKPEQLSLIG